MIECPECGEAWPDTYGADGGRRARFLHLYEAHEFSRGLPFNRIERL